jgi:hypothetical protein
MRRERGEMCIACAGGGRFILSSRGWGAVRVVLVVLVLVVVFRALHLMRAAFRVVSRQTRTRGRGALPNELMLRAGRGGGKQARLGWLHAWLGGWLSEEAAAGTRDGGHEA